MRFYGKNIKLLYEIMFKFDKKNSSPANHSFEDLRIYEPNLSVI